jgi:hypothetical protein
MPKYSCERCGKEFSQKSHYDSHKRRKKPCENYSNKIQAMVDKKVKEAINDLNLSINQMNTFKDLYEFLQLYEENNIITWLKEPWVGKDKQESLLRLFAGLGLIDKIKSYDICKGNYNEKTITKHTTVKDVFYNEEDNLINLKDKGDSSDLTGICKKNEKHLLVTTSKNLNKTQVGKLDIDKILTNFKQYEEEYTMSLCICVRDRINFETMKKNVEKTNHQLKSLLEKEDTIIIDRNDLNQAYHQFKMFYGEKSINNIINSNKTTLCLKMHQHLGVLKTLRMKNCEKKKILWGHIQRSGKSYIIGGCIIEDSKDKDECNYLVITTAPNETIEQQRKVFDCIQLTDFNIIVLNGKNKKPVLTKKNIIICSKQFLQNKIGLNNNAKITKIDKLRSIKKHLRLDKKKYKRTYNDIEIETYIKKYNITNYEIKLDRSEKSKPRTINWLKKMKFNMRFIDESHNGGTTTLAKKTLEFYGKQAFTVQITATYSKPINDYNIPKDCWILWDLEDIKLCKNITNEGSIIRLVEKHGDCIQDIISKYSQDSIISEYSKYPELWLLTDEINPDIVTKIINDTQDNNYGWSPDACFLLKQAIKKDKETHKSKIVIKEEFQNEGENLKLWYRIFGKKNKFGIPDKDYPDDIVFTKRIEKICKDPTIDSRFIGEGDFHNEPMIIMAFLPQNNIDKISKATIKLLERNNVIPDYEIISINSKTTNNPKQSIESARIKARNSGKKGVLVLSGKQCSLGVSIDNCDIVLLLNNSMGFDMIYQMMFRCMTEGKNKKCGFVVDLNIHRVIETSLINYASLIKPDIHPRDATRYILQERLINLNGDHWMPSFGNDVSKITALCNNVYELYSSNTENALNHLLNRLRFKEILLTKDEQKIFNVMFNTTSTKIQKELIDKLLDEEEKIKKGIEKTKVVDKDIDTLSETSNEKEEKQINYMDILKHIIPLICLLTIHNKETSFVKMFNLIETNEYKYNILIDQTKSWWGKLVDSKILKMFINVYIKYMKDDKETNQIIRTVKELFMKNIKNHRELSNLVDKYLIPKELEKKNNAEVSTPFKLRQEMLDKIPAEFWTSIKKVFEPCAGKGGFILDIIDRFMNGLEKTIPDEKERYKTIVEECLYFSDINSTNIYICKLLIDPYNEYTLNFNEGNTLELDIKEKWYIDGFDAVIGNPPYNSSGNTGTGNTIWQDFTKVSLNKLLKKNGYLLYVHPPGWRKPNTKRGKFYGLYKLMTLENQMIYLSIHGIKDGQKTFNCGTRYDWYIIQHTSKYTTTIVNDEKNNNNVIDMNKFNWLPNYNIDIIQNILAGENEDRCNIIYNRTSYGADKKDRVSKTKTDEFKYTCIHSTPKRGIRYMYSKVNDRGHFGVSKVIFGESGIYKPVIDMEGNYGMTHCAMAIQVDNLEEATNICKVIENDKFGKIIKCCLFSSFRIDWNIFKDFKKNFWKEFI